MTTFLIALTAVGVLLLTAVPGFIFVRRGMVSEGVMPGMSKLLLYVCSPCLTVFSFRKIAFSWEALGRIGLFALLVVGVHAVILGAAFLILRKKSEQVIYRILTIACAFGNCAFFGVPILNALFPGVAYGLFVYTAVYAFVMNVVGWTVGSAIIAHDVSYINVKKIFLNPASFGMAIGLLFFCLNLQFPPALSSFENMINLVGQMSSPLSMFIMGMRLGTMDLTYVFTNKKAYAAVAVKQILMPLCAGLMILFLPIDVTVKQTFYIICACPVASIVLNFSEIIGEGQKDAANMVLLGTMCSIVTLPIMMLLLPIFG